MFSKILISTVALLAAVNAMKVVSPDEDTEWSTSGSHTITWEAVSTDSESFQVVLDNQVSRARTGHVQCRPPVSFLSGLGDGHGSIVRETQC
jgi:hypothetical protein